ncbi:hypothetical protein [Streptomyces sp. 8N706]|uniref:hypothetical protein n=1 Tax=Streptomyces sp. 8N706 TaxID=3457416 RepID=UPI003FD24444
MLTRTGSPKCEVWLHCDHTVHQVRADLLILELTARRVGPETRRGGGLAPEWQWLTWTVHQHLDHVRPVRHAASTAKQEALFAATA